MQIYSSEKDPDQQYINSFLSHTDLILLKTKLLYLNQQ